MRSGPVVCTDLETVRSEVLRHPIPSRLLDYWRGLRRGRPMPSRADVDPTAIPWALKYIYLIDYEAPTRSFRYRLAGDDICRNFDRPSLKGLELADFMAPEVAAYVRERWLSLIDPPSILAMRGLVYFALDRVLQGERLMLPLSESGDGRATGLLGLTIGEWSFEGTPVERLLGTPRERVSAEVNLVPVAKIP